MHDATGVPPTDGAALWRPPTLRSIVEAGALPDLGDFMPPGFLAEHLAYAATVVTANPLRAQGGPQALRERLEAMIEAQDTLGPRRIAVSAEEAVAGFRRVATCEQWIVDVLESGPAVAHDAAALLPSSEWATFCLALAEHTVDEPHQVEPLALALTASRGN